MGLVYEKLFCKEPSWINLSIKKIWSSDLNHNMHEFVRNAAPFHGPTVDILLSLHVKRFIQISINISFSFVTLPNAEYMYIYWHSDYADYELLIWSMIENVNLTRTLTLKLSITAWSTIHHHLLLNETEMMKSSNRMRTHFIQNSVLQKPKTILTNTLYSMHCLIQFSLFRFGWV